MHLYQKPGLELVFLQPGQDINHGAFNEIGRSALHGGIDGGSFGALAAAGLAVAQFWQVEPAAPDGFNIAMLAGKLADIFHVASYAGVAGKVALDPCLGGLAFDAQIFRQAMGAHAVDEAKVNDFGVAPLFV